MFRKTFLATAVALIAGVSFQASAAETSSTFQVTATVASSCAIVGAANLDFGAYDPAVANATADKTASTSGIQVRCNGGTTAIVNIDEGLNKLAGSTCAAPVRAMIDGSGNKMNYTIGTAANLSRSVIGCSSPTNLPLTFARLETQTVGLFGAIPAAQNVPVGSYSDTLTVKVTF